MYLGQKIYSLLLSGCPPIGDVLVISKKLNVSSLSRSKIALTYNLGIAKSLNRWDRLICISGNWGIFNRN